MMMWALFPPLRLVDIHRPALGLIAPLEMVKRLRKPLSAATVPWTLDARTSQ
jgi:hypothetical protein